MLVFTVADSLPPLEYVGFLDKVTDLYEQGKLSTVSFLGILYGNGLKSSFVGVNFEHPAIRKILDRARVLVRSKDPAKLPYIDAFIEGDLADNYDVNVSDSAPPPETLPGIRVGAHRQRRMAMIAGLAMMILGGFIYAGFRWKRRKRFAVKKAVA